MLRASRRVDQCERSIVAQETLDIALQIVQQGGVQHDPRDVRDGDLACGITLVRARDNRIPAAAVLDRDRDDLVGAEVDRRAERRLHSATLSWPSKNVTAAPVR